MKALLSSFLSLAAICLYAQKGGEFHLDKEYKIDPKGNLKLSTSDANVSITGSNRTTAHVRIDREVESHGLVFGHEDFSVDVKEIGGDVEVREHSNSVSVGVIGYYHEKYTVNIEIPEGASLTLRGDDGDYWIKNVGGAISARLDDADLELTHCTGDQFEFKMDDGEIRMDEGRGKLEINGDDTDVRILHAAFTEVRSDMDDGDLVIETSLENNGNYFIKAQDGLVALTVLGGGGNFDIRHEDGRVTVDGDFKVLENSEEEMHVTLAEGSARVDIRADDARIKLTKK